MAGPVAAWGIDVGRCAFKALKLRPATEGRVEVIGHEYIEHAKILSQPDADRPALVASALERFLSRNDVSKDKVVVSVPGQHTLARFSKLPPVEPKKIPDIVRYEAAQQIPFDLDEVIWDYQTFQQEDSPDVEVGIFAMKRELIRDYLFPFQQAGIEPVAVQSAPLALYNGLCFDGVVDDSASVLLDIGADNTDLIVATRSNLWTRSIPLGGNHFTEALIKSFKLSFTKAEHLKRAAATSKYARQVFQAMRPIFADLVQELSRSLGFYRSTHREAELVRMIGLGNAFELPGLQKYLQQNLQLPVERPQRLKKVIVGDIRDAAVFKEHPASYAVAYGLGLQGLDASASQPLPTPIRSNLLPPEIVKQVVWRKKKPYFAAAAACLLLAAGAIWFRQVTDLRALAEGGETVSPMSVDAAVQTLRNGVRSGLPPRQEGLTWLEVAKALKKEYAKHKDAGAGEQERIDQIIQLQRNKAVWPKILAAIHRALPPAPPELAKAESADDYLAAIRSDQGGKLERRNRQEIFIEKLEAKYYEDLDKITDLIDMVDADYDGGAIPRPDSTPRRGFLITLTGRTPYSNNLRFVSDTLKASLHTEGRQQGQGFYINRVMLTGGRGYGQKPDDTKSSGKSWGVPKPPPPSKPEDAAMYDPLTDESMSNDWVFELKFDVVLADLPETTGDTKGS